MIWITLLFSTFSHFYDPANAASSNQTSHQSHYEAITGDTADDERNLWDQYYRKNNHAYGKDPISFLKDHIGKIKKGRAFVPAMGEGRNAIYLAKHGFKVEGNDISEIAIQKAANQAKINKVNIKANVADLYQFRFPENQYDFVLVSLFFSKSIIEPIKKSVVKGGYVMFYNQLVQSPTDPEDFTVKPGELREYFKDFEVIVYREYLDQGTRVAAILAKRPMK